MGKMKKDLNNGERNHGLLVGSPKILQMTVFLNLIEI